MPRPTVKRTTESKKTFTIVFNFSDSESLKYAKAISIFLGNFNPLREEMTDPDECLRTLTRMKIDGEMDILISKLSKFLK
ncbi:hypothetical protein J2810_004576 [Chryseobacterium rhizosphaerae]|uniref:hypothetical protein n=1 Tax=Chryseobacterium rhizosphaerae TaxID=395937 RepID=UPI002858B8CD|nr:hypothetical protein [Chryseobacterium rhizosphaerae]MDR6548486.1 hypothetical protein [Chryseobacterium rhizosphaerae]